MEKTHACSGCDEEKAESAYSKTQRARVKKGNKGHCKDCVSSSDIKRRYPTLKNGLTDKKRLCAKAENKCEICGKQLDHGGPDSFIDHNHATEAVRGILCNNCNFGFGHFDDKPALLAKAIAYSLEKDDGIADDETADSLAAELEKLAISLRFPSGKAKK